MQVMNLSNDLQDVHLVAERSLRSLGLKCRSAQRGQLRANVQIGGRTAVLGVIALKGEEGDYVQVSLMSPEIGSGMSPSYTVLNNDSAQRMDEEGNLWVERQGTVCSKCPERETFILNHVYLAIEQMRHSLSELGLGAITPRSLLA